MSEKYFVIKTVLNFEDTHVEITELSHEDDLKKHLNKELKGKDPAGAAAILKDLTIVYGSRVEPSLKKVIESVEIDL